MNPGFILLFVVLPFAHQSLESPERPGALQPIVAGTIDLLDSLNLITLYDSTDGANWSTPWDLDAPASTWHGVVLSGEGKVITLEVINNNLVGSLPSSLGSLSDLTILNLNDNKLSGEIPAELGDLDKLEYLGLWNNNLTGELPAALGNLKAIKSFSFANNDLEGSIPTSFGNLITLNELSLTGNKRLGGNIPPELGQLTNLFSLYISSCSFEGPIPEELGQLVNLEALSLASNEFLEGEIPASFENLKKLRHLYLFENQLSGDLPSFLGEYPDMESMYLHNNNFSGCFPESFSSLCALNFSPNILESGYNFTLNPGLPNGGDFNGFCQTGEGSCAQIPCSVEPTEINVSICEGETYDFHGVALSQPGVYTETFSTANGCDSMVILDLEVFQEAVTPLDEEICPGEFYSFGGRQLNESGVYYDTLQSFRGCDSIVELMLEVALSPVPMAQDDTISLASISSMVINPLDNDAAAIETEVSLRNVPPGLTVNVLSGNSLEVIFSEEASFPLTVDYTICNTNCTGFCDEASIVFLYEESCMSSVMKRIPKNFAPNSSIPENQLFDPLAAFEEADCGFNFGQAQLTILSRFGDIVYHADPYLPWDGTNNGKTLPSHTYYYLLRIEAGEAQIFRGAINLIEISP
jgi:gliding motility-associated-like protein